MIIGLIGANGRLGRAIQEISPHPIAPFTREAPLDPKIPFDLLLDVSSAVSLKCHLDVAQALQKPIVVGTTGNIQMELLQEASEKIPVFYSANFSLGIELLRQASLFIAKQFPQIKIIETHHVKKKDSPSGTALMLQKALPRGAPITSIREGEVFGKHEIHFEEVDEKLTFIHEAKNLNPFATGAILALEFLASKPPGFYTMVDLCKASASEILQ